jgi:hypothetical protein
MARPHWALGSSPRATIIRFWEIRKTEREGSIYFFVFGLRAPGLRPRPIFLAKAERWAA